MDTEVDFKLAYDHNTLLGFPLTSKGIDTYAYSLATDADSLSTFENTVRQSGNNHGQVSAPQTGRLLKNGGGKVEVGVR